MDKDRVRRRIIDYRSPCMCSLRPNNLAGIGAVAAVISRGRRCINSCRKTPFSGIISLGHSCKVSECYIKQPRDSINTCGARRRLEMRYCARDMDLVSTALATLGIKKVGIVPILNVVCLGPSRQRRVATETRPIRNNI